MKKNKIKTQKERDQMGYDQHANENQDQVKAGTYPPDTTKLLGKVHTSKIRSSKTLSKR